MEERKDNKGLASLEDILTNASDDTSTVESPEIIETKEDIVNIDANEEVSNNETVNSDLKEEEKSIFDEIYESDLDVKDDTNTVDLNNSEEVEPPLDLNQEEVSEDSSNENNNPLDISFEDGNASDISNDATLQEEVPSEVDMNPTMDEPTEPASIFENYQDNIGNQENVTYEDYSSVPSENTVTTSQVNDNKNSSGNYFGFERRVFLYSVLFVIPFVLSFFLVVKSFVIDNAEYVNYTETSNLDYNVYLKENSFYDQPFLGKDMVYVASLIDHIDIDFLYNFNISQKVNMDLDYSVVGDLSITDPDGKKVYFTKSYDLMPKKNVDMSDKQDHTFTEKIIIDYEQYNQIANSFKATYGVDTSSKLSVYLKIDKISKDGKIKDASQDNNMLIEIPLSQRSVSISMDYNNINNTSSLTKSKSISIGNVVLLLIALGIFAISIISLIKLLKLVGVLNSNTTQHDKYINKLMRQYDRLIVEHFTCPDLQKFNVIKIKDFNELLDMRDNLKTPILYYNVQKHQKSYFYIQNYKDLYLLVIKDVDLENEKNKK